MSYLSDPDRLERLSMYVTDDPSNATPVELAVALNDAAERIRSLQQRLELCRLERNRLARTYHQQRKAK